MNIDFSHHPCFNEDVRHTFGRVHLPVAPACNVQCNFCSRKYDCMNESRPGVSSNVLKPSQALEYLDRVVVKHPNISVVGIAGPGDPFANGEETMETLRLVRKRYPHMMLCVASNGLEVLPYINELAYLNVSHVTVTMNALDPEIGARIYSWVRYNRRMYRGMEAASILLMNQIDAISMLKEKGIVVKINSIYIPGINDHHIPEIAEKTAKLGVDIFNCIPLYSVEGTPFAVIKEPTGAEIAAMRKKTGKFLPQMVHCQRCRADAVGCIGTDDGDLQNLLKDFTERIPRPSEERPCIAVASEEGLLVNRHLGEARELLVYGKTDNGIVLLDKRQMPASGGGDERWSQMASLLSDCSAVLVSGVGKNPEKVLNSFNIHVMVMEGLIEDALEGIFNGGNIRHMLKTERTACGVQCSGSGEGC